MFHYLVYRKKVYSKQVYNREREGEREREIVRYIKTDRDGYWLEGERV